MLEDLIRERKERCSKPLMEKYPDCIMDGKLDICALEIKTGARDDPIPILEFGAWEWLEKEFYWRSVGNIETIFKKGHGNLFPDDVLKQIAEIAVKQVIEGKNVACSIPVYYDVCIKLGESPVIGKFVTDEDKKKAVNTGFWDSLEKTADPDGGMSDSGFKVLDGLMNYKDFFHHIDFKQGVEKAREIIMNYDFYDFGLLGRISAFKQWGLYFKWFLIQEECICKTIDKEEAIRVRGKLLAPMIYEFLHPSRFYDEDETNKLRKIVGLFFDQDIVKTRQIQDLLGSVFEYYFEQGLHYYRSESYSSEVFEMCRGGLEDVDYHFSKVWEKVKDDVDLSEAADEVLKILPKQEKYVEELKKSIDSMKRFNLDTFKKWMGLRVGVDVAQSHQGKIRNEALHVYYMQKVRPSKSDLIAIKQYIDNCVLDRYKINGFLFADFLNKKMWREANDILLEYEPDIYYGVRNLSHSKKEKFLDAVNDYVLIHGKLKIDEEGLRPSICYPKYNCLIKFHENRFSKSNM